MGRLQITPDMEADLAERRRRMMEANDGPQQMRFFDQMTGMAPQSAPSDFSMPTAQPDPMAATMPAGRAAFMVQQPPAALPEPPIPAPADSGPPQLPPPPNGQLGALGANPYLSSIVTGSGTRTMAYPQGPDGTFGMGQDLGFVPNSPRGNPADELRSTFMRNLYGNGTPSTFIRPDLAAEMALGEMRNRTLQQEGELQRQNMMDRERLEQQGRVAAAEALHKNTMSSGLQTLLMNAGLSGQADEAERLAQRFGLLPQNPNAPPPVDQSAGGFNPKAIRGLLPLLPDSVALPSRAGGKDVLLPGGLKAATPQTNLEFMNRLAGMNLDQGGMDKSIQQLRELPNGESFLDTLAKQALSERIAYDVSEQIPRNPITGIREQTPALINFDDLPGVTANAQSGGFWSTLRNRAGGKLPDYRVTLPGGRSMDLPVSSMPKARTAFGQTDEASRVLAQPEFRSKLLRSILRIPPDAK